MTAIGVASCICSGISLMLSGSAYLMFSVYGEFLVGAVPTGMALWTLYCAIDYRRLHRKQAIQDVLWRLKS